MSAPLRKRLTVATVLLVTALIAGVLVWRLATGDQPPAATVAHPDDEQATTWPVGVAETLGADLLSADPARVRRTLAIPENQEVPPDLLEGLAQLDSFTFDPQSFLLVEPGYATATATLVDDGASAQWIVDLVQVGDAWVIAATSPVLEGE